MHAMMVALGAAGLLLPAVAVAAENPLAASTSTVRTDDLDLAKPADRNRLEIRLAEAAADVCGRRMDLIHNMAATKARACQAEVVAENRARVEQLVASANAKRELAMR